MGCVESLRDININSPQKETPSEMGTKTCNRLGYKGGEGK